MSCKFNRSDPYLFFLSFEGRIRIPSISRLYSTILTINSVRNYELLIHQVDPDLLFFLRGSDPINLSPAPSLRSADITLNIKNKGISAAPSRKPFYCSGVQVVHLQVLSVYLSLYPPPALYPLFLFYLSHVFFSNFIL